jgi:hypothetical protein
MYLKFRGETQDGTRLLEIKMMYYYGDAEACKAKFVVE